MIGLAPDCRGVRVAGSVVCRERERENNCFTTDMNDRYCELYIQTFPVCFNTAISACNDPFCSCKVYYIHNYDRPEFISTLSVNYLCTLLSFRACANASLFTSYSPSSISALACSNNEITCWIVGRSRL